MLVLMHLCFFISYHLRPDWFQPQLWFLPINSSHFWSVIRLLLPKSIQILFWFLKIRYLHFSARWSLKFKPGLLKCVLCSPCLAFFPSWPFAILVLHSVLLKLSIFNLCLPKFLSFFPPFFSFFLSLNFIEQTTCLVCFLVFSCASMDIPIHKPSLDGSAFSLAPSFSLNIFLWCIYIFYCGQLSDNCSCCLFQRFCLLLINQSYLCLLDSCSWRVSIQRPQ